MKDMILVILGGHICEEDKGFYVESQNDGTYYEYDALVKTISY